MEHLEYLRSALQPVLQPLTQQLPEPIRDLGVSIIGEKCYSSLVLDIDVADSDCLKLVVSKALGIGIVGASSIVKVPQIVNLVRSRSASGVSFLSYLLETSSYLISLAYNVRHGFPFSTYGETALILGQNVIITVLVLNYSGRAGVAALFVAVLAGAMGALFTDGLLDMNMLGYLQAGAGTLGVASKVPQILAIWQEGGTGQLSAFTVSFQHLDSLFLHMGFGFPFECSCFICYPSYLVEKLGLFEHANINPAAKQGSCFIPTTYGSDCRAPGLKTARLDPPHHNSTGWESDILFCANARAGGKKRPNVAT